ncbi:uncharacterized protein LAESUDRAFT_697968 [Laetiporus sulphureus 93-53]|uniref:Protein transport protein SEC31 n=1 Tax=Laetiporus sulphureus 93-53 TaxID=1314785 RepID=A0A165EX94_9APHY|nr:uncharacterized protein LAESUDRAFT_697968 [Laetiporus sulphureus 93-53]KZT07919.1 hypothetical protein LAESUDRAFT_697968 [Laetiporus sulphureus 93-53]
MKLKEIHRTSTFAWSPSPSLPLLATGTVAGALDESFSNNGQLEIWAPDFLDKNQFDLGEEGQAGPKASVTTTSRFNRLAWGYTDGPRARGVIVAGMENGELDIWDPAKILANADPADSLILRNKTHTGAIRGLDFNPIQMNLFASGAVNGEIYIWDLKDPSKPYSPGTRSTKLDEITALAWNHHVQYALAASSSTGYTVVWDLRGKREVAALAYGGGAGTLAGGMQGFGAAGMAMGGRRGMSDVAWHPDNATRLVTSSEDDTSPIIMVWDLRNARAPEKILTGHEKGVLSLSWCKQDADLLLSCGKDNRALCWNPQTSEIIGELPPADNWAFQVQWCPRNPDLFATAFFDGTIGIHSIQSTNEASQNVPATPQPDASDIFGASGFARASRATLSLKHPPKWLRRPVSSSFGYGGKLVSVSNLPSAHGRTQSSVVHIRKVVTEKSIVERATKLQAAIEGETMSSFAEEKTAEVLREPQETSATWKALLSLFKANSRDELITLLGFSKEEVAAKVAEAVAALKAASQSSAAEAKGETTETELKAPVVSFAEPESEARSDSGEDVSLESTGAVAEATPSEVSTGAASDNTNTALADGESTTTAPSLFGDELIGTPQTDAAADFFGSIGTARSADDQMRIPHTNYALDSSVAATIGSGPSSVTSEVLRNNTFKIYPPDESETDRLVTKALVLGDFESAVSLCLSSSRFADAILLAVKGGQELLQRTQKAYFENQTATLPYLRLFQSIVTNDLADVVQNADLQEWQEIFVVLCTFASQEEFSSLAEQLGQRLEFQADVARASEFPGAERRAIEYRRNATLTYLAAGRLERLVNIWIEEMAEEEHGLVENEKLDGSRYTAHALALQTFVEKVTVFRSAIRYEDTDLTQKSSNEEADARSYKLSGLYDRYYEYADLLASQGLVKEAVAYLKLTPPDYHGWPGSALDFAEGRERLLIAAGEGHAARTSSLPTSTTTRAASVAPSSSMYGYTSYSALSQPSVVPQVPASSSSIYEPYSRAGPTSQTYAPTAPAMSQMPPSQSFQSTAPMPYNQNVYARPPSQPQQAIPLASQQPHVLPPPPRATSAIPSAPSAKRENGGWNDVPHHVTGQRRSGSNASRPAAIMSPFPNAPASPGIPGTPTFGHGQPPATLPPPPGPGSVQARPPPPPQGHRMAPPPQAGPGPYPMRPPSGPPGAPGQPIAPGPGRMMMTSPPPNVGVPRAPPLPAVTPDPYAPLAPIPGQTPPPHGHLPPGAPPPGPSGPYVHATPPPQGPPPMQGQFMQRMPPQQQQLQPGTFAPPLPRMNQPAGPPPPQGPPQGLPRGGTPGNGIGGPSAPPSRAGPPPPKYPLGDRSHIPDDLLPVYNVISGQLERVKQISPPSQKRLTDDLERRINPLFDALNCETLSKHVQEKLIVLSRAMEAHDREAALNIHMDLLTSGTLTDDIGLWMSGVKQLIVRL